MVNRSEEISLRFPRVIMNLITALIFWLLSVFIPPTLTNILIPGINVSASLLVWIITSFIMAIFLVRALADSLILGDIVTDVIIRRLGIKEERTPKRAARDFVYIIIIILVVTAISPILRNFTGFEETLSTIFTYGALSLIIILIYDIGRILYRLIEQKAKDIGDSLAKMSKSKP